MVDVSTKPVSWRLARASADVVMRPETLKAISDRRISKGDVFEVARLAGMMAAKRTPELIPLCHSLGLEVVDISLETVGDNCVRIEAAVSVHARTGVEMEAMTAVSIAALTVYDMCKAVDREIEIGPVRLLEKSGGKSGHLVRDV